MLDIQVCSGCGEVLMLCACSTTSTDPKALREKLDAMVREKRKDAATYPEWREAQEAVALDLLATNRAQAEEIEKLKQEVIIAESGQDADLRHIQALREALAEIYALRGEDSTIARICNRHL